MAVGFGVGVTVGIGVAVGFGVGVTVGFGVAVGFGVGVTVGIGVAVGVPGTAQVFHVTDDVAGSELLFHVLLFSG